MLRQASVSQIRKGEITRDDGYVVITMRFYPRGLRKELRDEYRGELAPEKGLFKEFKRHQAAEGHDEAFRLSRYERRFALGPDALAHLKRLSELARKTDVFLVCQCAVGERCHRELLLLMARKRFNAPVDRVFHRYPDFRPAAAGARHGRPSGSFGPSRSRPKVLVNKP
jgi:uncharacterized protein YeaO (DUF488 family)